MHELMETSLMISYEDASILANNSDPAVRRELAERTDLPKEILYFLADDPDPEVRRTVARNSATPSKANLILAHDTNTTIRANLAHKLTDSLISKKVPKSKTDRKKFKPNGSEQALHVIARDQEVDIRRMLSGLLQKTEAAPYDVIKTLAWDGDADVSMPVLTHSPVLQESDLIEHVQQKPTDDTLKAISKRQDVSENVSDVVVATNNVDAISELLLNSSTQFREQTLDELVDKSRDIELWQSPLVSRPTLSPRSMVQLSQFIDTELLGTLKARHDIDPEQLKSIDNIVAKRQKNDGKPINDNQLLPTPVIDFLNTDLPYNVVRSMQQKNRVSADILGKALESADYSLVMAALIIFSKLPESVVKIAFREKSARGIVSICWKAGLFFELAIKIQQHMGRLAPSQVLTSTIKDAYPMNEDEMNWHLDFFKNWAGKPSG